MRKHTLAIFAACWQLPGPKLACLLLAATLLGCSTIPMFQEGGVLNVASYQPKKPVGPMRVKADSGGLQLSSKDNEAARGHLVDRVSGLMERERYASARAWVERYPDVALDVLREAPAHQQYSPDALTAIAAGYDQQCLGSRSQRGWSDVLRQREAAGGAYEKYAEARGQYLEYLQNGQIQQAAQIRLHSLAKPLGPLMEIDAWHLAGMAALLDDRPQEAVEAFAKGTELARRHDPHQAAELLLLLSDAERRLGQHDQATASWQQAALLGGELLSRSPPICNPQFWERASYMRPADQRWPQAVGQQLIAASGLPAERDEYGLADPRLADVALWVCLGRWRLERDEPEPALVALKQAEAVAGDARLSEPIRLTQAKAMYRLKQTGAATAILTGLTRSENPRIVSASTALLGSIRLQSEQVQLGHSLLQKSLQANVDWPDRGQAEADLGLACLMMGDETQGLRWLHSAQSRFEAQADHELLAKCLYNESEYFKAQKQKQQAQVLADRLATVERRL